MEIAISGWSNNTALILAAENGHTGVIELLVKHVADVNEEGEKYVRRSLRILTQLLQIPRFKQHLSWRQREGIWTWSTYSLRLVPM